MLSIDYLRPTVEFGNQGILINSIANTWTQIFNSHLFQINKVKSKIYKDDFPGNT